MSQVYSTEPATTGRVVVDTTHGPIDIDLWCKECPTTTRTFLQLCLDGYYDGMIFHRILSDFLIQTGLTRDGRRLAGETPAAGIDGYLRGSTAVPPGGESTSTSSGGGPDALGRDRKRLEVNPRIRFNHRGQVAMALPLEDGAGGEDDDDDDEERGMLRYQFFVTLDEAPFLDAKHVVFGTVAGATVFNALRIGRTDADERTGVPTDAIDAPPRIRGVRVDYHPFGDLVVTADGRVPWKKRGGGSAAASASAGGGGVDARGQSEMERRQKKRKGKRDLNVLSFGDEERDYEEIVAGDYIRRGGATSRSRDIPSAFGESQLPSSKDDADVGKRRKSKDKKEENNLEIDANCSLSGREHKSSSEIESLSNVSEAQAKEHPNEVTSGRENGGVVPEVGKTDPKIERGSAKDDRNVASSKSNSSRGMGAVEARRTKYLKSGIGSSANNSERLKREGETMARLFAFKIKVLETKGSGKDGIGNGGGGKKVVAAVDDSLASRMAKRVEQTEDGERRQRREKEALAAMPGYSGRVNRDDGGEDGDDGSAHAEGWMGTTFKCKRHMDQDSRMTALDMIDADDMGGDGRRMDDYVVLDEKRRGGERGHHRTGSAKHAGRTNKGSDRDRPTR
jgi:peptidyl-prolyl cis-trans isomerase SDCCAG10